MVNGNNDIMAAYFAMMKSRQALNWLEALPSGSINSWQATVLIRGIDMVSRCWYFLTSTIET